MFGLPKFGNGIGFRRLLEYCDQAGIDLDTIGRSSIVITGSNGKGSTARFLYECLRAHGERVGCFISPHLFSVNERFEIAGMRIDDAALQAYTGRVLAFHEALQRRNDALGAFEALFLIALSWFHDRGVDQVVWEAGIGGRYDPVRVLRSPLSVLTSVDLEHTELLGATRQLIAFEKLDVTRPGGRTFISSAVGHELAPDLEAFATLTSRTLTFIPRDAVDGVTRDGHQMRYRLILPHRPEPVLVTIPLPGIHQVQNSAAAIHVAGEVLGTRDLRDAINAIERMKWPGRMEKISDDPEIWIDVGHTPEAVLRTCATLVEMFDPGELLLVFGVSEDKRVREIAAIVQRHFRNVLLTRAYKNGADPSRFVEAFEPAQVAGVSSHIEDAIERARSLASLHGWKIAVIGGLFLAVEFAHAFRGGDPRALELF